LAQQPILASGNLAQKSRKGISGRKTRTQTDSPKFKDAEKQGLDLSVASETRQALSISLSPSATVTKQRMLDCGKMSFAVASPLDRHAQSPTAHPILRNNVMHSDASNFAHDSKPKEVEFAAFLPERKSENDQVRLVNLLGYVETV